MYLSNEGWVFRVLLLPFLHYHDDCHLMIFWIDFEIDREIRGLNMRINMINNILISPGLPYRGSRPIHKYNKE